MDRTVKKESGDYTIIDSLKLNLSPLKSNEKDIKIEFYNSEEKLSLSGELQIIEKWGKIIQSKLKK